MSTLAVKSEVPRRVVSADIRCPKITVKLFSNTTITTQLRVTRIYPLLKTEDVVDVCVKSSSSRSFKCLKFGGTKDLLSDPQLCNDPYPEHSHRPAGDKIIFCQRYYLKATYPEGDEGSCCGRHVGYGAQMQWCSSKAILGINTSATLNQIPHDGLVTCGSGLMQGRLLTPVSRSRTSCCIQE